MNRIAFITLAISAPENVSKEQFDAGCTELYQGIKDRFEDPACPLPTDVTIGRAHVELEDVRSFHHKFGVPMSPVPAFLDPAAHTFRAKFLQEELSEFHNAYDEGNLDKAFDALLDLAYVTVGTALKMGLPWAAGWQRVQSANMTKRLAKPDGSDSKRGSPMDVVKPADFVAPSFWDLLDIEPNQPAHVFNATNAVLGMGYKRKNNISEPTDMLEFVRFSSANDETAGDGSGMIEPDRLPGLNPMD